MEPLVKVSNKCPLGVSINHGKFNEAQKCCRKTKKLKNHSKEKAQGHVTAWLLGKREGNQDKNRILNSTGYFPD